MFYSCIYSSSFPLLVLVSNPCAPIPVGHARRDGACHTATQHTASLHRWQQIHRGHGPRIHRYCWLLKLLCVSLDEIWTLCHSTKFYLSSLYERLKELLQIKPLSHQSGVLTAFKKIAERRCARCANGSNAVETLCNRLERHAAAFTLSMLKTNAAAWRFHSLLDSTLWQRCGVFYSAVGRYERAVCTL